MEVIKLEVQSCLFCGSINGSPFIKKNADNINNGWISAEGVWSLQCLESICCLFRIPNLDPVQAAVENCHCCGKCRQMVQDIDFTLRLLNQILQRLQKLQSSLLDKVKRNWDEGTEVRVENAGSLDGCTYKELVKALANQFSKGSADVNVGIEELKHLLNLSRLQNETKNSYRCHTSFKVKVKSEGESQEYAMEEDVENTLRSYSPGILDEFSVKVESESESDDEIDDDAKDDDWQNDAHSAESQESNDEDDMVLNTDSESDYEDSSSKNTRKPTFTKTFKCSTCSSRFATEDNLNGHCRKVHENDPTPTPYHCSLCSGKFRTQKILKYHLSKRHKNPAEDTNDDSASGSSNLPTRTTEEKKYLCPGCPARFSTKNGLMTHRRKVHANDSKPYHCRLCSKKFGHKKSLERHTLNKHGNSNATEENKRPYVCDLCAKGFVSEKFLQKHKDTIHNKPQTFFCTVCKLNFTSSTEKEAHEELHKASGLPFQCTVCQALLPNSIDLQRHVASVHSSNQMVCDICGVKCSSWKSLRVHRKIHNESFAGYPCEVCGHVFRDRSNLKQHMHKHSNTKPYMCEICGKGFNYPDVLKVHRASHDPDRSWKCSVCGKAFSSKPGLVRHEEIHSGSLSYECRTCKKKFMTRSSLRQHEKIHLPKNPNAKRRIRHRKINSNVEQDPISENKNPVQPLIQPQTYGRFGDDYIF